MRLYACLFVFAALVMAGCGTKDSPPTTAQNPPTSGAIPAGITVGDYELGAPVEAGNAKLIPVLYTKQQERTGNEISLTEAKKLGLVEIIEIPGAEEVNRLRVHNKSDRPLLLIGGELLLGGKQDRIVVHDVVIPPGKTEDVDVDCVEHGRWEGKSEHFDYSDTIVPSKVREQAAYGDQGKVWDNVSELNGVARGAPTASGTIRSALNSPDADNNVRENMPRVSGALNGDRVVGVIYVLNGEIRSMDLFGNPKLFQSSKESLLHGFLAESAVTKGASSKMLSGEDFKTFFAAALNGKREEKPGQGVYYMAGDAATLPSLKGNEVRGGNSAAGALVHGSYSLGK